MKLPALVAAVALALPAQALADDPTAPELLNQDIQAAAAALRHIAQDQEALYRELTALRAENAKLKAPAPTQPDSPH